MFSPERLRELRNDVKIDRVLAALDVQLKHSEGFTLQWADRRGALDLLDVQLKHSEGFTADILVTEIGCCPLETLFQNRDRSPVMLAGLGRVFGLQHHESGACVNRVLGVIHVFGGGRCR